MRKPFPSLAKHACLLLFLIAVLSGCAGSVSVRIASFNTALSRDTQGALHQAFAHGDDENARLVAEVVQRTRPDIVLLQEVDYDPTGKAYAAFQSNYLGVSQGGAEPIEYPYVYAPSVNTGVLAEVDLNGDGRITRPHDCYGYGLFPGHYGMVVMSKYPIDVDAIFTFREVLWKDLPGAIMPPGYFPDDVLHDVRLSSKTHAIVPIQVRGTEVDLLISHPTPPVFDGPEDRNGRRNYDEIGLWLLYLDSGAEGRAALFKENRSLDRRDPRGDNFVVMGDLNADPNDGASRPNAVGRLLSHHRINHTVVPRSRGAAEAARLQGGFNLNHKSDPAADTSDWNDGPDRGSGNLRVDYVLPGIGLHVIDSGVYWPMAKDPHAYLNRASDHKLVWIDVAVRP